MPVHRLGMQHKDPPRFPYDVFLNEEGEGWDVIDLRTNDVIRLNDVLQTGLPGPVAEEIADLLNDLMRTMPQQRH